MDNKLLNGFYTNLLESELKFKPVAPPNNDVLTNIEDDLVSDPEVYQDLSYSDITNLTNLAERRDQRYTVFDRMRQNDSLAAAALEMYADDITQPDPQGKTIWVESENSDIADAANRLIRILGIEEDIWGMAYSLVCYGDVYYELFPQKKSGKLMEDINEAVVIHKLDDYYTYEDYIERVNDPSEVFDLVHKGHTVGYARTHVNDNKMDSDGWNNYYNQISYSYQFNTNDIDLYDSRKFVHIYIPDAGVRHPYRLTINDTKVNELREFKVETGKSLFQDAYKASQQLQLSENSILLSRLTRASLYRLIQVNVGQQSETKAASLLHRVKSLLDKKQIMDTMGGSYGTYANPGPEVSNIVIPVKDNGQGSISSSTIGGDYDPKSLVDLDYLINKELAAFKIPRQFLNFTDGGGFNGGSSLAKISSQYAHRITRYKRAIIHGVTELLNIFFDNRMPDYVGNFEVKMTQINTTEDAERIAMARDKLEMVNQIMSQLDDMDDIVGKFEILKDAFEDAYPNSVVSKVLGNYIDKLKASQPGNKPESTEGDEVGGSSGGGSGDSSYLSLGDDIDTSSSYEDSTPPEVDIGSESSTPSEFPTDLSGSIDYTNTAAIDSMLGEEE